jgi:hypothetical protein
MSCVLVPLDRLWCFWHSEHNPSSLLDTWLPYPWHLNINVYWTNPFKSSRFCVQNGKALQFYRSHDLWIFLCRLSWLPLMEHKTKTRVLVPLDKLWCFWHSEHKPSSHSGHQWSAHFVICWDSHIPHSISAVSWSCVPSEVAMTTYKEKSKEHDLLPNTWHNLLSSLYIHKS